MLLRAPSKPEVGFSGYLGEQLFEQWGAVLQVCSGHIEKKGLTLFRLPAPLTCDIED